MLNRLLDDWNDDEQTHARSKRHSMNARYRESKDLKPRIKSHTPKASTPRKLQPSAHEDPDAFLASYSAPVEPSPHNDGESVVPTKRRASGAVHAKKRRPKGAFGFK